jgi:hypothetical protein
MMSISKTFVRSFFFAIPEEDNEIILYIMMIDRQSDKEFLYLDIYVGLVNHFFLCPLSSWC